MMRAREIVVQSPEAVAQMEGAMSWTKNASAARSGTALVVVVTLLGCAAKEAQHGTATQAPQSKATAAEVTCTWCAQDSANDCSTLCISENRVLAIAADGSASGGLRMCNRSNGALRPELQVSDFSRVADTQRTPLSASARFSAADPANDSIVKGTGDLLAGQCLDLKIEASKLNEAGLLAATLRHAGADLVELKAVRSSVPFRLKVDGPTRDKLELTFVHAVGGSQARIRLRNEDPLTYRFRWRLELGGEVVGEGLGTAYPEQRVDWTVRLREEAFSLAETALIRPGEKRGRLLLEHEPDPSFRLRPIEQAAIDATARLSFFSPVVQGIVNSGVILALLIVGVLLSLFVNYVLPLQRKRIELKQRLAKLEGRLARLGGVVDSQHLNLLRVEKRCLRAELFENRAYFPSTDEALPKLAERARALERRIELTVQVGDQLLALRDNTTIAPTEFARIEELCGVAIEVAGKAQPDDADVKAAQAILEDATKIRAASDEVPSREAVQVLLEQAKAIREAKVPEVDEWRSLADMMSSLQGDLLAANVTQATRELYVRAARSVAKGQLVLDFVRLIQGSGIAELRDQRWKRRSALLEALQPGPGESLRRASEIVREVEQNVDKAALVAELKQAGSVRVEFEPRTPLVRQVVRFRVVLDRPGFDAAAARQQIPCRWRVSSPGNKSEDGRLPDTSWTIGHYFELADPPSLLDRIKARRRHSQADQQAARQTDPPRSRPEHFVIEASLYEEHDEREPPLAKGQAQLDLQPEKSYGMDIALVSAGTTAVAVGIVVLGLLSGAEEKVRLLDWWSAMIAVVALGFSADVLKRILMKP
jgi:hypothetical protein